jgi:hypothetical protein
MPNERYHSMPCRLIPQVRTMTVGLGSSSTCILGSVGTEWTGLGIIPLGEFWHCPGCCLKWYGSQYFPCICIGISTQQPESQWLCCRVPRIRGQSRFLPGHPLTLFVLGPTTEPAGRWTQSQSFGSSTGNLTQYPPTIGFRYLSKSSSGLLVSFATPDSLQAFCSLTPHSRLQSSPARR